jgi:hypothetical protein
MIATDIPFGFISNSYLTIAFFAAESNILEPDDETSSVLEILPLALIQTLNSTFPE